MVASLWHKEEATGLRQQTSVSTELKQVDFICHDDTRKHKDDSKSSEDNRVKKV